MKTFILSFLVTVSLGSEFQVNTRTSRDQANAAIAMAPDGNFIVVWSSYYGTSGSITRPKMVYSPAPSILAASARSTGSCRK